MIFTRHRELEDCNKIFFLSFLRVVFFNGYLMLLVWVCLLSVFYFVSIINYFWLKRARSIIFFYCVVPNCCEWKGIIKNKWWINNHKKKNCALDVQLRCSIEADIPLFGQENLLFRRQIIESSKHIQVDGQYKNSFGTLVASHIFSQDWNKNQTQHLLSWILNRVPVHNVHWWWLFL